MCIVRSNKQLEAMGRPVEATKSKLEGKSGRLSMPFLLWSCGSILTVVLLNTLLFTVPWRWSIRGRPKETLITLQAPSQLPEPVKHTNQLFEQASAATCASKELRTASDLFHEDRFDLLVKLLYIRFVHRSRVERLFKVPSVALDAYLQHEKVWNRFREDWKRNPHDFQSAFEETYSSVVQNGFLPAHAIPVVLEKGSGQVWLKNGAHRSAIAIALGLDSIPVYCVNGSTRKWDWRFFHRRGLPRSFIDAAVYHFLHNTQDVFMLNIWPSGLQAMEKLGVQLSKVLEVLRRNSGKVMYWKDVSLNFAAHSMYVHMAYGNTGGLAQKQNQTYVSNYSMMCIFVLFRDRKIAQKARKEVRSLVHLVTEKKIDNTYMTTRQEDLLLLSRQILFSNALHYMNFSSAEGKVACRQASINLASMKSLRTTEATPGMPLHVDHFSVDGGSVLNFYGLRPRTKCDLIYDNQLQVTNCKVCGEEIGIRDIGTRRFWYENVSIEDILYNPQNVGYCYGLKFVALKQVLSRKEALYEESKDALNMELLHKLLLNNP